MKLFLRQVLGCGCPEEVFNRIESASGVPLDNGIILRNRINVGNRLLVYVATADSVDFVKETLPGLVRAGKDERDEKGFHRFRLVLASDDRKGLEEAAEKTFNALPERDEKVHFHVVEKSLLFLLEGNAQEGPQPSPCTSDTLTVWRV